MSALRKVIEVGETKGNHENYFDQGKMLNPAAWEDYDTYMEYSEDYYLGATDVTYESLTEEVTHQRVVAYKKYETGRLRPDAKIGFNTQSGRIELYSWAFLKYGDDPLPYYMEPPFSPVSTPELAEKYPLVLTTGARTYTYFHSEGRQIPFLREITPDPVFEMNEVDAKARNISEGD